MRKRLGTVALNNKLSFGKYLTSIKMARSGNEEQQGVFKLARSKARILIPEKQR